MLLDMKTEIEIKAERMAMECAEKWAPNTADFLAAYFLKHIPLVALLTAEAENVTLKEVLSRYQNAARTGTATELLLSTHETESWRQLAKDAEAKRDELKGELTNSLTQWTETRKAILAPANCGVSGHFKFQENGGHCMMCQQLDQLRAELASFQETNFRQAAKINDISGARQAFYNDLADALGIDRFDDEAPSVLDAVKKLKADLATAKAELEKWKLGCETNADCYKTAVRDQDNQRLELLKAKAENAALKLDTQRLNVKISHLENALTAKDGK